MGIVNIFYMCHHIDFIQIFHQLSAQVSDGHKQQVEQRRKPESKVSKQVSKPASSEASQKT